MFYYPTKRVYVNPADFNIEFSDYFFSAQDGPDLHGRLFRHNAGRPYQGIFVLFHGNAENLTSHFQQFAWVLDRGFDLFVFDYAGYGASKGKATRSSTIQSGATALEFVSARLMPPPGSRLVLVGASLGGAILLHCLPEWKDRERVTLALMEAPFHSYQEAARSALAKHWITWPLQPLTYFLITEVGSPAPRIPSLSPVPLLVVSCREDPVVDPHLSQMVFALARYPKWHWEFPPCHHIQALQLPARQDSLLALVDSLNSDRLHKQ